MTIQSESLPYRDENDPLTGFLCWDDAIPAPRPGVLVIHGGAGLDEHAKAQAERLARMGVVAFACDMFGSAFGGDRLRAMTYVKDLAADRARLCRRAQAGLSVLKGLPQVDGRAAAVGYCFGGLAVLELARAGTDLAGVVSVHGSLKTSQRAEPGTLRAKVLVCHGALDPHVPLADVSAFVEEMNHAQADWQFAMYGGAMHGFTHADAGSKVPGVAYHAAADRRSLQLTCSFFEELFGELRTSD